MLVRRNRLDEAEAEFRDLLAVCRRSFGADSNYTLTVTNSLADVLIRQERFAECEAVVVPVVARLRNARDPSNPGLLAAITSLARVRFAQARYADARSLFAEVLAATEANVGTGDIRAARLAIHVGLCHHHLEDHAEAIDAIERGAAILLESEGPPEQILRDGLDTLIALLDEQDETERADAYRKRRDAFPEMDQAGGLSTGCARPGALFRPWLQAGAPPGLGSRAAPLPAL